MPDKDCHSCQQAYDGADCALRCRINGLKVSLNEARACRHFLLETGRKAEHRSFCGGGKRACRTVSRASGVINNSAR